VIEKRVRFVLGGTVYVHADPVPDVGEANRFGYGDEPKVIAQVPLEDGDTVEVHGYATFYTQEWVTVDWNDDNYQHFNAWIPATNVRRPLEGEWQGRYVAR
jgi:hypothetical protein